MLEKLDYCPLTDAFKEDFYNLLKKHGIVINKFTDYLSLSVMITTCVRDKIKWEDEDDR